MNRLLKKNEFREYDDLIKSIDNVHHTQLWDAKLKWGAILNMLENIEFNKNSILEVGAGNSHLLAIIQNKYNFKHALALDNTELYPNNKNYNIDNQLCDFLNYDLQNKYDLIIDVCSMHLFDESHNDSCCNVGYKEGLKKIYKSLNPGGYFLAATDVSIGECNGQFISPNQIMNLAKDIGFKIPKYEIIENPSEHEHTFGKKFGPTDGKGINIYAVTLQK